MALLVLVIVVFLASTAAVLSSLRSGILMGSWRARLQIGAWALASCSALLFLGTIFCARIMGGFEFWDPVLMQIYRYGAIAALIGLVVGLLGVGRVRVAVVSLSAVMLMVWLIAVSGE